MARVISRTPKSDLTARQSNILDFLIEHIASVGFPPSMREIGTFFSIKSTNGVSDHLRALERKGYITRSAQKGRGIQVLKSASGASFGHEPPSAATDGRDGARLLAGAFGAAERSLPWADPADPDDAAGAAETTDALEAEFAHLAPAAANTVSVPLLGKVAAGKPILAVELAERRLRFDASLLPAAGVGTFALRVHGRSMIEAGILPEDLIFVLSQPHAENGEIVVAMVDGEATVKRYYDEGDRVRLQPENREMAPMFVDKTSDLQLLGRVVGVWRNFS